MLLLQKYRFYSNEYLKYVRQCYIRSDTYSHINVDKIVNANIPSFDSACSCPIKDLTLSNAVSFLFTKSFMENILSYRHRLS